MLVVYVVRKGQCSESGQCDSKSDVVCVVGWTHPLQTGYSDSKSSAVSAVGCPGLFKTGYSEKNQHVVSVVGQGLLVRPFI